MLSTANISDIWPFCKSMTSNPSPCLPNITFVCLPANLEWLLQEMEKLLTKFCSLGFRLVAPLKPLAPRVQTLGKNILDQILSG